MRGCITARSFNRPRCSALSRSYLSKTEKLDSKCPCPDEKDLSQRATENMKNKRDLKRQISMLMSTTKDTLLINEHKHTMSFVDELPSSLKSDIIKIAGM